MKKKNKTKQKQYCGITIEALVNLQVFLINKLITDKFHLKQRN